MQEGGPSSEWLRHAAEVPSKNKREKFLPMLGLFPLGVARGGRELVKSALRKLPAAQVAAGILAMLLKGTDASSSRFTTELLPPIAEDHPPILVVALLALSSVMAMVLSCLFGYACGRCHAKTEVVYVDKPIYNVEAPVYVKTKEETKEASARAGAAAVEESAEQQLRVRRPEERRNKKDLPEEVFIAPSGDCYHIRWNFCGLDKATTNNLKTKRPCYYCAGGEGGRKECKGAGRHSST